MRRITNRPPLLFIKKKQKKQHPLTLRPCPISLSFSPSLRCGASRLTHASNHTLPPHSPPPSLPPSLSLLFPTPQMRRITVNAEKCQNEHQVRYLLKHELQKFKVCGDDMWRNRQGVGHSCVYGYLCYKLWVWRGAGCVCVGLLPPQARAPEVQGGWVCVYLIV